MQKRKGEINIDLHFSNRWLYTFIVLGILAVVGVGVYAVAPSSAQNVGTAVFGHHWSELGGIPTGFADGIDNTTGITSESDPQVGTVTNNKVCHGDGSAIQCDKSVYAFLGHERISSDFVSNGPTAYAYCSSSNKIAIGGGCSCATGYVKISYSDSSTRWRCTCSTNQVTAHVICINTN